MCVPYSIYVFDLPYHSFSFSFLPLVIREDFKALLREVRHKNKDSLSGVSVEFIAQQVKLLIEQREKKASSQARESVGVARGLGRAADRQSQLERRPGKVSLCEGL